jgi:hypothetical protein
MMVVAVAVPLRGLPDADLRPALRRVLPIVAYIIGSSMGSMGTNMALAANCFGTFDRDGFATVAQCPVDRRYVLLASNLAVLLYVMAQDVVLAVAVGALTRSWLVIPLGLFTSLCAQVGVFPVCSLTAILAPYRTQLKFGSGHRRGNIWGMLAWAVSTLPVVAAILVPLVLWQPGLAIALPVAAVYSAVLYVVTLRPLSRLLMRHEYEVLRAVAESG